MIFSNFTRLFSLLQTKYCQLSNSTTLQRRNLFVISLSFFDILLKIHINFCRTHLSKFHMSDKNALLLSDGLPPPWNMAKPGRPLVSCLKVAWQNERAKLRGIKLKVITITACVICLTVSLTRVGTYVCLGYVTPSRRQ